MYYTALMKLSSYAKRIGISYNSAWRMWKRGQIPGYQLPIGTVIIDPPELRSTPVGAVAMYARVSSSENKDNLERQAERLISWCNAQGWEVSKVIKECGSGINDQRPKFLPLLGSSQDRTDCCGAQGSSLPLWSGLHPDGARHAGTGTDDGQYC